MKGLLLLLAGFIGGIVLCHGIDGAIPLGAATVAGGGSALLAIACGNRSGGWSTVRTLLLCLGLFCFGYGRSHVTWFQHSPGSLATATIDTREVVHLTGTITGVPEWTGRNVFLSARVSSVAREGAILARHGALELRLPRSLEDAIDGVRPGMHFTATGRVFTQRLYRGEASERVAMALDARGLDGYAWLRTLDLDGQGRWAPVQGFRRASLAALWTQEVHLLEEARNARALAAALLFGERRWFPGDFEETLERSGLMHVVAISGFHTAMLISFAYLAVWRLGGRRDLAPWLALAAAVIFWMVSGGRASVSRAVLVASLYLVAEILGRPIKLTHALAVGAFVLLLWRPHWAFDLGFQLSFIATWSIAAFARTLRSAMPTVPSDRLRWFFAVSFAAELGVSPILGHVFGRVPGLTYLHLALISTVMGLWYPLAGIAMVGAAAGLPGSAFLVEGTLLGSHFLVQLFTWAGSLETSTIAVPPLDGILLAVWYLGLAAFFVALVTWNVTTARRLRTAGAGLMVAFAALWLLQGLRPARWTGPEVLFHDVGQGNALSIHLPGSWHGVIDTGPEFGGTSPFERQVIPELRRRNLRQVDWIAMTHGDTDHIGGTRAAMASLLHGVVAWGSPRQPDHQDWRIWEAAMADPAVEIALLSREGRLLARLDSNDQSGAFRLVIGEVSILVTGDLTRVGEAALVTQYGGRLRSDVLLAGHHGDEDSNSDLLLDIAQPQVVVASAGRGNRFGHPSPLVAERLERRGIPLLTTQQHGTWSLQTDGQTLTLTGRVSPP